MYTYIYTSSMSFGLPVNIQLHEVLGLMSALFFRKRSYSHTKKWWDRGRSSMYPLTFNVMIKYMMCSLISQGNNCSMGYTFMRCEGATFPIRFGKLSPPLFGYFSSSAVVLRLGMQQQRGSHCSLFSCQSPLCTKMLIGPNPPLEAVLVA